MKPATDYYNPFCTEHGVNHGEKASRILPCVARFAPNAADTPAAGHSALRDSNVQQSNVTIADVAAWEEWEHERAELIAALREVVASFDLNRKLQSDVGINWTPEKWAKREPKYVATARAVLDRVEGGSK